MFLIKMDCVLFSVLEGKLQSTACIHTAKPLLLQNKSKARWPPPDSSLGRAMPCCPMNCAQALPGKGLSCTDCAVAETIKEHGQSRTGTPSWMLTTFYLLTSVYPERLKLCYRPRTRQDRVLDRCLWHFLMSCSDTTPVVVDFSPGNVTFCHLLYKGIRHLPQHCEFCSQSQINFLELQSCIPSWIWPLI